MASGMAKAKGKKTTRRKAPPNARPRAKPGGDFVTLATDALARREPDAIADADLQKVFAASVRLYAAKSERRGEAVKPFGDGAVTTTESIVAACALIRAADLNLFDVAMWFNRASPMT
jgi:hypothetical protein